VFHQLGVRNTVEEDVLLALLRQIASEPCYDQLRTKEQLGYAVSAYVRKSNGTHGLIIVVQGEKHPEHFVSRIDHFIGMLAVSYNGNHTSPRGKNVRKLPFSLLGDSGVDEFGSVRDSPSSIGGEDSGEAEDDRRERKCPLGTNQVRKVQLPRAGTGTGGPEESDVGTDSSLIQGNIRLEQQLVN
jgi:hypothetical protein